MSKLKSVTWLVGLALLLANFTTQAQLFTNPALTPQVWVLNHLIGTGVTVSNITYSGVAGAAGTFVGNTNLGLYQGVILTSGRIDYAAISTTNPQITSAGFANNSTATDADLSSLIAPTTVYDICKLEFDFTPQSDTVKFRYVFGSDEYPEFVGTGFNDVFGFFISGPGITGPYQNNGKNIALIPFTTTAVAINNVNQNINTQYYISNGNGTTIQYDGFTTILTAQSVVIPCQSYHIKLCIGDGSDHIYDSGVFLEENSFSASAITVNTNYYSPTNPTATYASAVEGCRKAYVRFTLPFARTDTFKLALDSIRGTAVNGVDYVHIDDTVKILPYFISGTITIDPIYDGVPGPNKTVILYFKKGTCSFSDTSVVIPILDYTKISTVSKNDTSMCEGQVQLWTNPSHGMGPYSYVWFPTQELNNALISNPLATPTGSTWYYVLITDSTRCSEAYDSIHVTWHLNPMISFMPSPLEGCDPVTVNFLNNTTPNIQTYLWDFGDGTNSNMTNPMHTYHFDPGATLGYNINLTATTAEGCAKSYSVPHLIKVYEQPHAKLFVFPTDTAFFPEQQITLSNNSTVLGNNHYLWSYGGSANVFPFPPDSSRVISYPQQGNYMVWLWAYNDHGCKDSISAKISVHDWTIEIPNIMTPNADGTNDKFVVKNIENYPTSQLVLFDRWGKKIFEASPYHNTFDAQGNADGVYYYILKVKRGDQILKWDGSLTVMR